ncbi:Predicted oxidoreductase [Orenia metallireducens]|uniref:Predicted oxidoreductase n=1 Tax=Orenia metallireducens TaxID=1413210 RepID=A0A285HPH9_9FIRM|nr:aldo/keto reductase [Orenia metallireducens]SNY36591.1 Predicted oxidoreductase [Orenia metallireducens]
MQRIKLSDTLEISRVVHGHWRLADWDMSKEEIIELVEECLELGITTFDHADIYGNYTCEAIFGEALSLKPKLRDEIELVTKCGIKLISENCPEHKIKSYDTSKEHIRKSVENSLRNFKTDYIDLLLIHRPDPFMDADQVAEVFTELKEEGKVLNFGVSNFKAHQFSLLSSRLDFPLLTNQIELSVMELENIEDGTLDYCQEKRVAPMAWSPMAGGRVFTSQDEKAIRVRETLEQIAKEVNAKSIDQVMYAWLLEHPAKIIPIVGSGKIKRIKSAVAAMEIELSREQWFEILQSSMGHEVP